MKTHDELMSMTQEEREAYRAQEVEKLIAGTPANKRLMLRALQARITREAKKYKNPWMAANAVFDMMMENGLNKLNETLNGRKK
jgi:hypothetical protein